MIRPTLKVVADPSNIPAVDVPCAWMWDLIEYLSYQRVAVHYDFKATHFTATFPRQTAAGVQELLDHWSHAAEDFAVLES